MSLRAVDPRFLLPTPPRTASIIGDPAGWSAGLRGVGVELVDGVAGAPPDLVVAGAPDVAAALDVGAARCLILGGDVTRQLRSHGLEAEVYLAVPDLVAPEYLVPIAQARTVRYFYDVVRVAPTRARWYRNRAVARVAGLAKYAPGAQLVTVAGAALDRPFGVAAAAEASGFAPGGWYLDLGQATADRRVVFSVFDGSSPSPRVVVKLDRQPRRAAVPVPDDREGRWLADPVSRGPLFAGHVPRPVAEVPCGSGRATIETAAVGHLLTDYLRGPFSRRRKLEALETVAGWLVAVAGATAHRGSARRTPVTDASAVRAGLGPPGPGVPRVLEHGDLWSGNVVYRPGGSFTVIDWADADPEGLPLRDLLYFLADTLALVDRTTTDAGRDRHFGALFRGELPASALLFRWVRAMVGALDMDPAAVGPLVSWGWEELADRRRESLGDELDHTVEHTGPELYEPAIKRAEVWGRDPQLGGGWTAWIA